MTDVLPPRRLESKLVIFLNDRVELNGRYRKTLIARIEKEGFSTRSVGVFSSLNSFARALLLVASLKNAIIVSSNLKANLFFSIFFWRGGFCIINGMGRYYNKKLFRYALIRLLVLNKSKKTYLVQSFRDYRYLRRYCSGVRFGWIPGSGGVVRDFGDNSKLISVQRDGKIEFVKKSLLDALRSIGSTEKLLLVGVSAEELGRRPDLSAKAVAMGYVPQEKIFSPGGTFVQPEGYGEGIPQTFVDAICSGMDILITGREARRYGIRLSKLSAKAVGGSWFLLSSSPDLQRRLNVSIVDEEYLSYFLGRK